MATRTVIQMLCLLTNVVLSIACSSAIQEPFRNNASYHYNKGVQQYDKKRYAASVESFLIASKIAPDNPQFLYCAARAYAAAGKSDEAIKWLDRTVRMGFHFDVDRDPGFDGIRGLAVYSAIVERVRGLKLPVTRSVTAFTIQEPDLMPESIAYDPITATFYVGSTYKRKVTSIDRRSVTKDFIAEEQDGLWSVLGMKVDPKRRILWVLSSVYRGMKRFDGGQFGMSAVHKFDLEKGRCIKKYVLDDRPKRHSLNDLVLNGKGDVFLTDDQADSIYWISHETDRLEVFLKLSDCTFLNGICLSEDETCLYFSHTEGISAVDVRARSYRRVSHPMGVTLCGIDGLYLFHNSLVGIQVYPPERIVEFRLADDGVTVNDARVVEVNNPLFELPTTGVIVEGALYFIANSQLRKFTKDGTIFPIEKLNNIVILKATLVVDTPGSRRKTDR